MIVGLAPEYIRMYRLSLVRIVVFDKKCSERFFSEPFDRVLLIHLLSLDSGKKKLFRFHFCRFDST
jgi:hypothetical protein